MPLARPVTESMSRYSRAPSGESYGTCDVLGGREFESKIRNQRPDVTGLPEDLLATTIEAERAIERTCYRFFRIADTQECERFNEHFTPDVGHRWRRPARHAPVSILAAALCCPIYGIRLPVRRSRFAR
ncbi:nuclear transport factor 2 family protein [Nocardia sputi]|uniref:nuclear transport factor 2 family protein n=1 Tax=Nocardia sputi TaxID=2943705 RepID=UPI0020BE3416|nr:nuclear transport factor 2 family protein [Nocardia sputi]